MPLLRRDCPPTQAIWWSPYVKSFRTLPTSTSPITSINTSTPSSAPQIAAGCAFTAVAVNVPQYLLYLLSQAKSLGAQILQQRIPTEQGLAAALAFVEKAIQQQQPGAQASSAPEIACFVNATGLGAARLCADKAMFPIRGQTVLVRGEAEAIRTRVGADYLAYCIPRPGSGTTILGGTREEGVWDESVDSETTVRILRDCRVLAPELLVSTGVKEEFEVVSVQVGLRPARSGGARMEVERVENVLVVHAYGHAGAGYAAAGCAAVLEMCLQVHRYQNSIGAANKTVRLVRECTESEVNSQL